MERWSVTLPAMYADHHVTGVRRALLALEGVTEVVCSAAARRVSLAYDPSRQDPAGIEAVLAGLGYHAGQSEPSLAEASPLPTRLTAAPAGATAFLHSSPAWQGRPLWPCPGFDPTPVPDE